MRLDSVGYGIRLEKAYIFGGFWEYLFIGGVIRGLINGVEEEGG
jgi:hypothetical protein